MNCVVYRETCFNVWSWVFFLVFYFCSFVCLFCLKQNSQSFSVLRCAYEGRAPSQAFIGSCNSDSNSLSPWFLRPGLCLVGVFTSHCCASCMSFWIVTGWQVWQAHSHLRMLCAKSSLSYSSFGVFILLSYLHECIQPEFPEHGDFTSKPLLYQPTWNHDEEKTEKERLQKLM